MGTRHTRVFYHHIHDFTHGVGSVVERVATTSYCDGHSHVSGSQRFNGEGSPVTNEICTDPSPCDHRCRGFTSRWSESPRYPAWSLARKTPERRRSGAFLFMLTLSSGKEVRHKILNWDRRSRAGGTSWAGLGGASGVGNKKVAGH